MKGNKRIIPNPSSVKFWTIRLKATSEYEERRGIVKATLTDRELDLNDFGGDKAKALKYLTSGYGVKYPYFEERKDATAYRDFINNKYFDRITQAYAETQVIANDVHEEERKNRSSDLTVFLRSKKIKKINSSCEE